ncbi:MAG TPA: DHH family phosphoesterase [Candidatus Saccharimonadia bacterium]
MDKELTPKQQTSEAIRQADTILLMTGQHPNIDQVASTIALAAILRKFGKKVTTVISDDIPAASRFLPTHLIERDLGGMRDFIVQVDLSNAEVDKLKYAIAEGKLNINITPFSGGFSQRDVTFTYGDLHFDLVIVLGVLSYSRIDKVYVQNAEMMRHIPLINIDFHRINEQYGAVNLLETSAASLAEILIALAESLQSGLIDADIATTMLTALYAATDRFTAVHTTAKTMTVAAQMVAGGADHQKVVKHLFGKGERGEKRSTPPSSAPLSKSADQASPAASAPRQTARIELEPVDPRPTIEKPALRLQRLINPEPGVSMSIRSESAAQAAPADSPKPETPKAVEPAPVAAPEPAPTPAAVADPTPQTQPKSELPLDDFKPAAEPQPEPSLKIQSGMEDLLPPQHIELTPPSDGSATSPMRTNPLLGNTGPEPLINAPNEPPKAQSGPAKAANPTNNPIFAQRLDEFEY